MFDENMQAAAPALMDQLRRLTDDGTALFDANPGQKGGYGGVAILHHIAVADFAGLLLDGGRVNRDLLAALARRYQYWGAGPELLVERPWLTSLQKELDARANALGAPFDQALKQSWAKPFAEMFAMLNLGQQRARAACATAQSRPAPAAGGGAGTGLAKQAKQAKPKSPKPKRRRPESA